MSTLSPPAPLTPQDVERASEHDAKRYELIDGVLKEKALGTRSLFVANRICERLNGALYPAAGFAITEGMTYCFDRPNHGRRPDVAYVRLSRLPNNQIPEGDLHLAPDLVVEVLSPGNSGFEVDEKLNEYLAAGVAMVWIVHPDRRTIRVYRNDGTTRLFQGQETIENEPLLPGFRLPADEVFPTTLFPTT